MLRLQRENVALGAGPLSDGRTTRGVKVIREWPVWLGRRRGQGRPGGWRAGKAEDGSMSVGHAAGGWILPTGGHEVQCVRGALANASPVSRGSS